MCSLRRDDPYPWRRSDRRGTSGAQDGPGAPVGPEEVELELEPDEDGDADGGDIDGPEAGTADVPVSVAARESTRIVGAARFGNEAGRNEAGGDETETGDESDLVDAPRMLRWLTLMVVSFVALVLIEYQIHPAVPAVLLCFKLCFGDLRDAVWLMRRDPEPTRGTIVALWYLTRAMWHVGAWAFFLMIVIYVAATFAGAMNQGMPAPGQKPGVDIHTVGRALVTTFGVMFAAALAMTYLVVLWATVAEQPVWLGKGVSRWRTRDRFPPFVGHTVTAPNDASSLVTVVTFSAGIVGAGVAVWFLIVLQTVLWPVLGNGWKAVVNLMLTLLTIVGPLGILIGTMIRGTAWMRPVMALAPEDCWGVTTGRRPEESPSR